MAVNPVLQAGVAGIRAGVEGVNRAAQAAAELNLDAPRVRGGAGEEAVIRPDRGADRVEDALEAVVDLTTHKRQVQASARVVDTADEVLGFLLDIRV